MKILAIVASPRLNGNTNYLVDQALDEAASLGAQTEKIVLSQHRVNPCLGHTDCDSFDTCQQQDDTVWILDKFSQADGVILATPVYYYNVSAWMKAFIDRNYFLYRHNRKAQAGVVGLVVIAGGEGVEDALHTLKLFVDASFNVSPNKIFSITGYASDPGEIKDKQDVIKGVRELGRKMVQSL